ncbi:hypothetical protein [Nocardioides campestrisoli]|uniref:hypothetical protein n=1 Tax=Nocardioides campestrisoli TaxID=2736757 RepID=UPI00163D715F|nr:hypothetical protein [Nocardioides campestrisoli]
MPNRRVRGLLALAVLVGSVLPGLATTSAAADVPGIAPSGGCWTYVPAPMTGVEELAGHADVSTTLEPWTVAPVLPEVGLATSGATAVGGARGLSVGLSGGPAVAPQPAETTGTVTYLLDAVGPTGVRAALPSVAAGFTLAAGMTAIPATTATGVLPLTVAGSTTLVLRGVVYDLPALGQRIVCNGQAEGMPGGVNPATTPLDPGVATTYVVAPGTSLVVSEVGGQRVTTAARAGDTLGLTLGGFPSGRAVELTLCAAGEDPATPYACGTPVGVPAAADGSAVAWVPVPEEVAPGDGLLRASVVGDVPLVVETPLQILGEPTVSPHEKAGPRKWRLIGDQWDPGKPVRLSLRDADGKQMGPRVVVEAGPRGRIRARLPVPSRREVVEVRAVQRSGGALSVTLDLDEAGLTGSRPGRETEPRRNGGGGEGSPEPRPTPPSSVPRSGVPVVVTPVEIPEPLDLDVDVVDGEVEGEGDDPREQLAPVARGGEVAVTEAVLVGSTDLGDLFGGAPSRVLRLSLENVGRNPARAPGLTVAVGKDEDAGPVYRSDGVGTLAPGETRVVEVPVSLPTGAFGTYVVSGQVGDGAIGGFAVTWQTYPWGLLAANLLGVLLIAWAVRRRSRQVRPDVVAALAPPVAAGRPSVRDGEAVIDLATLARWWELQAVRAGGAGVEGATVTAASDDAVIDLAALDRWMATRELSPAERA